MMSEQNQADNNSMKTALGIVNFVCRSLATSVEVFLHRSGSFGERYLGLQAAAAVLCIFGYTAFWPYTDVRPVLGFMVAYIAALAVARVGVFVRRRRAGPAVHSFYTGTPRLTRLLGRASEFWIKRFVEPALVFIAGVLTLAANEPLGVYLMAASFALFASVNLAAEFVRTRALNMNDAFIDQSTVAEQFRDMRGH